MKMIKKKQQHYDEESKVWTEDTPFQHKYSLDWAVVGQTNLWEYNLLWFSNVNKKKTGYK